MVFRKTGRAFWDAKVPSEDGTWHLRSTRTKDKLTAKKFQRMLDELGPEGSRAWDLLGAVVSKPIILTLPDLYDAWSTGTLEALRQRLSDIDLATYIPAWLKDVKSRGVRPDTAAHYEVHVRTLIGVRNDAKQVTPYLRSALTTATLKTWLAELDVSSGTRRKYHASMSSFLGYLASIELLPTNLMRDVQAPKAGKPRDRHLTTDEAITLADAHVEPYRTFSALLAGTGMDVSTGLLLTRRDINTDMHEIRARGTKTHNRDRVVRVASWAWPYLERHIATLLPDAPLFTFDRWEAGDAHRTACETLGITNYWMRDARHTWAVRWARAGGPPQQGAAQLGHKDATLFLKVYSVYYPTSIERDHWEQVATQKDARDAAQAPRRKQAS